MLDRRLKNQPIVVGRGFEKQQMLDRIIDKPSNVR
jgi:hypothetical protein